MPRTSSTPATSGRRSCSARSTTRPRPGWSRCRRRTCRATPPTSRTTGRLSDRLTLNLGLRWEFEPGPTDQDNRLSQRLDLTQPIPEMAATPPSMPAQAQQLMASKGYALHLQRRVDLRHRRQTAACGTARRGTSCRGSALNYRLGETSVVRAAYARFLMPTSNVRDTLGDFVNQYTGFAQTTTTLGLINGRPSQVLADPFPSAVNPVIEPYGQAYGRYTGLGSAVSLDQFQLRPQLNDRFTVSFQKEIWAGIIADASYFFNWGSRVPYDINLNMADPSFRYEQKAALNTSVPNPFRNYLTPADVPGPGPQHRQRDPRQPAGALPAVRHDHPDQHRRPAHQGADAGNAPAAAVHPRHQLHGRLRLRQGHAAGVLRRPGHLRRAAERRRVGLGVAAAGREQRPRRQPPAPHHLGRHLADSGRPRARRVVRHAGGARLAARRLAGHRRRPLLLGPPGHLQHQLRGQRRPDARQPDPRPVVRHQRLRGAGRVHRRGATRGPTTGSTARACSSPT